MKAKLTSLVALLIVVFTGYMPATESEAIAAQVQDAIVDLSIERDISDLVVAVGEEITWRLSVTNLRSANDQINQVLVNEILSRNLELGSVTPSHGDCHLDNATQFVCDLGSINLDATVIIDVVATVIRGADEETLTSTAYVSNNSGKVDPIFDNNVSVLNIMIAERRDIANLIVSPLCSYAGAKLLVTGQGLFNIARDGLSVEVGGQAATSILLGDSSLSIIVPPLEAGEVTVTINGEAINTLIEIDPNCAITPIDAEGLGAGIVPGELLIFFKEGITDQEIEQFAADYNFESISKYPLLGFHRGRLADEEIENQNTGSGPGEICTEQRQSQYPELELMLLVDVSGTMDSITLRDITSKLIDDLDCALNPNSRVGLMTYSDASSLLFPLEQWHVLREKLLDWLSGPISTRGFSDLESALFDTSEYLSSTSSNIDKSVFVLTRGASFPLIESPDEIELSFRSNRISLTGIAFTSFYFGRRLYDPLEELIIELGRPLFYYDERVPDSATRIALCAVVVGIYAVNECGHDPLEQIPLTPRIQVDPTERLMELIADDFRIDQVCLNNLVEHEQFDDPQIGDQTWLQTLGVEHIESYFPRLGNGVNIAVIDTGVDLAIAGLGELSMNPNIPEGMSFATSPDDPGTGTDIVGHGTKVASVTAAAGNNLNGIGVAPRANLIPIRVFASAGDSVKGNSLWVAEALASAYLMGADVINMSLGDRSRVNVGCQKLSSRDFYERIFANLKTITSESNRSKTPILVAATGNDGRRVRCPACVEDVIAVGTVRLDENGNWERSPYSNYGDEIDLVAQGDQIMTTLQGGEFGDTGPGTSFSAPQVTGLIALMLGENPNLTATEAFEIIKTCFVEDLLEPGWDEETGWGRIVIPAPSEASIECLQTN